MTRLFQSLLYYLALATDRELAKHVQFLKEQNRMLREGVPDRFRLTPSELRRLIKYGRDLGPANKDLITVVTSRTFARWMSGEREGATDHAKRFSPR